MIPRALALCLLLAPTLAAQTARDTSHTRTTAPSLDSLQKFARSSSAPAYVKRAVTRIAAADSALLAAPAPVVVPPSPTSEPVYLPGLSTLQLADNMDGYPSVVSMGAVAGTMPRLVPIPAPLTTSQPVDTLYNQLVPGRSGRALRMRFPGLYQTGAKFTSMYTVRRPSSTTHYVQYWARITPAAPITGTVAVKWLEMWHVAFDRVQWNTHDHLPCPSSIRATYWQVYDQGRETHCQGNQPIGPYFDQMADGQWHRYTYSYRPNSAKGARDGFARMWIDGVKVIDVSQATIGITPSGGTKSWCEADDVDALAVNDGITDLVFGSTQTTPSPAWTLDIDDLLWWVA